METKNNSTAANDVTKLTAQLRLLQTHLAMAHEADRKRISTYLNDSAVQTLAALHIKLSMIQFEYPELAQQQLAEALALIVSLTEELTLMARELRPLELDALGLNAALQQASEEFGNLTQLPINYEGIDLSELSEAGTIAFFYLLQEAFTNIRKHAEATEVWVSLQDDGRNISLTVKDNGKGFDTESDDDNAGVGLFGAMERFGQLNGRVSIQSTLGQGTLITAILPY